MRALTMTILLLLAPTVALAGSADAPETTDPAHDARPDLGWNDMLAAWFEEDAGELVLAWSVASYDGTAPSACWNTDFSIDGVPYAAITQNDPASFPGTTYYAMSNPERTGVAFPEVTLGAPATFRVKLAQHVAPLSEGATVQFTFVRSCQNYVTFGYDDVADGAPYVAVTSWTPPVPAPSTHEGRFLVGDPVTYVALGMCGSAVDDVTQSCFPVAASEWTNAYAVSATEASGTLVALQACFWDWPTLIECDTGRVPEGATIGTVAALGGVDIRWRLDTSPS